MKCKIILISIFAFHYFDDLLGEMKIDTEAKIICTTPQSYLPQMVNLKYSHNLAFKQKLAGCLKCGGRY